MESFSNILTTKSFNTSEKKFIKKGVLCLRFSPRNTFFILYDSIKSTAYNLSNGKAGFKGSTRGTLYASEVSTKLFKEKLNQLNFTHLYLKLQGFSRARRKILRLLTRLKIQKNRTFR
jgi:ribosomal protein S11